MRCFNFSSIKARRFFVLIHLLAMNMGACAQVSTLVTPQFLAPPTSTEFGPHPDLSSPSGGIIPTINIAPAKGWSLGGKPIVEKGFSITAYAADLNHPRWLYVLPNGDVLVAESNAPEKHDEGGGIKGWIQKSVMKSAGAGVSSADRITLLRGIDDQGHAKTRTVFLEGIQGLHSPFGMVLVGNYFMSPILMLFYVFPINPVICKLPARAPK